MDTFFRTSIFSTSGECVAAARTLDGFAVLRDTKPGAAPDLLETREAYEAFVADHVSGKLAYGNLTAAPSKGSYTGDHGFSVRRRSDGIVVVTSDHPRNSPAHPGLEYDRAEWDVCARGCKGGEYAYDILWTPIPLP